MSDAYTVNVLDFCCSTHSDVIEVRRFVLLANIMKDEKVNHVKGTS